MAVPPFNNEKSPRCRGGGGVWHPPCCESTYYWYAYCSIPLLNIISARSFRCPQLFRRRPRCPRWRPLGRESMQASRLLIWTPGAGPIPFVQETGGAGGGSRRRVLPALDRFLGKAPFPGMRTRIRVHRRQNGAAGVNIDCSRRHRMHLVAVGCQWARRIR